MQHFEQMRHAEQQAIALPGNQRYLSCIIELFISSFVLSSQLSFLVFVSWVFSYFFFPYYPRLNLRTLFLFRYYQRTPRHTHSLQDEL